RSGGPAPPALPPAAHRRALGAGPPPGLRNPGGGRLEMRGMEPALPEEMPRPSRAVRFAVVAVLLTAGLLAFGVGAPPAARRGRRAGGGAVLRDGKASEALEEADLRLSRQPDDPHLRNVAVQAARVHIDSLLEQHVPTADVAAWLDGQLRRRPYLRPALEPRL